MSAAIRLRRSWWHLRKAIRILYQPAPRVPFGTPSTADWHTPIPFDPPPDEPPTRTPEIERADVVALLRFRSRGATEAGGIDPVNRLIAEALADAADDIEVGVHLPCPGKSCENEDCTEHSSCHGCGNELPRGRTRCGALECGSEPLPTWTAEEQQFIEERGRPPRGRWPK